MKRKFLVLAFVFASQQMYAADYIDTITRGIRSGAAVTGEVYSTFKGMAKDIIGARAKKTFERAIGGGHTIYLEEDRQVRATLVPHVVPFIIDVTEAKVRSRDGRTETENATRLARKLFNGEPEAETLVRKRKFMQDEFGYVNDPAPGERKVLDVWYRCLDDRKSAVGDIRYASAHEMNNIELSCMGVPSVFKKRFG